MKKYMVWVKVGDSWISVHKPQTYKQCEQFIEWMGDNEYTYKIEKVKYFH